MLTAAPAASSVRRDIADLRFLPDITQSPCDFALDHPESGGMMSPFVRIDKPVGVPPMKALIRRF